MPGKYTLQSAPVAAGAPAGVPRYRPPTTPPASQGGGGDWLLPAAGVAAGAGIYALTKSPLAVNAVKSAGNAVMDLRRMSMLSGMAPIKSFLGNIGGTVYDAIEHGSMASLRELFSPTTAKEALTLMTSKAGPSYSTAGPATGISRFNLPGRIMGSFDTAAQNALIRAGRTPGEAAQTMLQAPVPELAYMENNPVADYLVPFRRTPMNQFKEGIKAFMPKTTGQKVALGTALGTGVAEGALIEDPKTQAMATAAAGRYGLPTAAAAAATRALVSGSKTKGMRVMSGMSPISDYSLSEGAVGPLMDPVGSVIPKPALLGLIDYLKSIGQ